MRYVIAALLVALAPSVVRADNVLKDIISDPDVQVGMIINLRNPQMRQQLNASLAQHPGSAEKINRFANSITHVAVVALESEGNKIGVIVAVGKFDKGTRQMLQNEGLPAELMDSQGVCLGMTINGQALGPQQLQQLAAAMRSKRR